MFRIILVLVAGCGTVLSVIVGSGLLIGLAVSFVAPTIDYGMASLIGVVSVGISAVILMAFVKTMIVYGKLEERDAESLHDPDEDPSELDGDDDEEMVVLVRSGLRKSSEWLAPANPTRLEKAKRRRRVK